MLCRPPWSRFRSSSRLPAGTLRSPSRAAVSTSSSFLWTTRQRFRGIRRAARVFRSRNRSAVVSSPKDRITPPHHTTCVSCSPSTSARSQAPAGTEPPAQLRLDAVADEPRELRLQSPRGTYEPVARLTAPAAPRAAPACRDPAARARPRARGRARARARAAPGGCRGSAWYSRRPSNRPAPAQESRVAGADTMRK
jgi:hypothetical protein